MSRPSRHVSRIAATFALAAAGACGGFNRMSRPGNEAYLFVWAADRTRQFGDFLAVIAADPRSHDYGRVVSTVSVGAAGTFPHHTEHEISDGRELWANGFGAGRTFRFDVSDPRAPRVRGELPQTWPYAFPHSFVRLPNGHVLTTLQLFVVGQSEFTANTHLHEAPVDPRAPSAAAVAAVAGATGGLAEFSDDGRLLRIASADAVSDRSVRPYGLAVVPALDRIVTTANDMSGTVKSRSVQIWRLSDFRLLATLQLPPGPRGDEQWNPAEPRLLSDGRTVLVNTSSCGLYRLDGLEGTKPAAEWIYSGRFDTNEHFGTCALAVVAGPFWLQTNASEHAVVSLDVRDPSRPREVGRLTLGAGDLPHWIAMDRSHRRLVITGNGDLRGRVLMANVDPETGSIVLDERFQSPGSTVAGVDLSAIRGPRGEAIAGVPHAAVFSTR